jgi:tetratricopeptide (TPR) repeat protein
MESVNTIAKLEETHSLAGFLQRNRKFFAGLLIAVVAAVVVFFVAAGLLDAKNRKELVALEDLVGRYEKLADRIETESSGTDVEALRVDLQDFAGSAHGYAGAKAWALAGTISAKQGKWSDSESAFAESAVKGKKTHLYGPGLFNAGVAAEEGGDIEKAIGYYARIADVPETILGARAQFSIGRLQEAKGDKEAARIAYRNIIENNTGYTDDIWRNFAQSRLIAIDDL